MKQIYANNAKSTLTAALSAGVMSATVANGSIFPSPFTNEFFLATLELGGTIEIVQVTSVVGNTFFFSARGLENTNGPIGYDFPVGARIECRVTKETLDRLSKSLAPLSTVDSLVAPKNAYNDGYVCASYDPVGNPAIAIAKDANTWRFLNYTSVVSGAVFTGTTTSEVTTASAIGVTDLITGKYLIQFTSGIYVGYVRQLTSFPTSLRAQWTLPLPGVPGNGDTFEIFKADSSIRAESTYHYGIATGSGDTQTVVFTPKPEILFDGLELRVRSAGANTITAPTINFQLLNGTNISKTITNRAGAALTAATYGTSHEITLRYNSTLASGVGTFELISASGVTTVNGHSGTVALVAADLPDLQPLLGFTPYNSTNPSSYITAANAPVRTVNSVSPVSGNVALTFASFSGTLPVASGGSGATTLTGILKGNGGVSAFSVASGADLATAIASNFVANASFATSATSANSAASATSASSATNLQGNYAGQIWYQSSNGVSSVLPQGAAGYYLQANGGSSAPTWETSPTPPGSVIWFAFTTPPSGWLVCNGSSISTSTYSVLFGIIGYTFGGSGGTFQLPNVKGRFIRGWESVGTSNPTGEMTLNRVFGTYQADGQPNHTHSLPTFVSTGANLAYWGASPIGYSTVSGTQATIAGAENRGRNIALLPIIKY